MRFNNIFYIAAIVLANLLFSAPLSAQKKPSTYLDRNGTLRWQSDKSEIAEFGVHYALPFSTAYMSAKEMGLDLEKSIDKDIYHLARLGLKAYRVHMWDAEVTDTLGNLRDNEHMQLFDYTIKKMKDRGFKMIITPLNYYPTKDVDYGIGQKYGKAGSYTEEAVEATKNYLAQLMNHTNPYTGFKYKEDPSIIGFEIYNEPELQGFTEDSVVPYINGLVDAIRKAGCRKPLFWCMSIVPDLINGFVNANVQGGSFQWYSVSHNAGFTFKGNLLTHLDQWPKDTLTDVVKNKQMALIAYELDAADNAYSYTYPAMAREMRTTGFQFASMFSYDPIDIAAYNVEYRTHFANLAYAPKKAMGLKIAGEVFRKIPRFSEFGQFPQDTTFDVFRVSHQQDLAEMVTDTRFIHSNTTTTTPPSPENLTEICGLGSSPVVHYDGRGIYFLDKLEDGIWRLEVMPDAIWVDEPFGNPQLGKEMSAIVWSDYHMTIQIPDLGENFSINALNKGNEYCTSANDGKFMISPGTYLLVRNGIKSTWGPEDAWEDIRIGEYVAPEPTDNTFLVHTPVPEISRGKDINLYAEVISEKIPDKVILEVSTLAPGNLPPITFRQVSRYGYLAQMPDTLFEKESILKYQITALLENKTIVESPEYMIRIVEHDSDITLVNISEHMDEIRRNHRHYSYHFLPSEIPGLLGLEVSSRSMTYASHYVVECTAGRKADLASKSVLSLRAYSSKEESTKAWIILQERSGKEFGVITTVSPTPKEISIPLSNLRKVKIIGPGEKGFVHVFPVDENNDYIDISDIETVKVAVLPEDNPQGGSIILEYVTLK